MSRPVKDHTNKTVLYLEMIVYAILDVVSHNVIFLIVLFLFFTFDNVLGDFEFLSLDFFSFTLILMLNHYILLSPK